MEQETIRFSVSIGRKDLYRFLLYHTYHSMQGAVSLLISLFAWAALFLNWKNWDNGVKMFLALLGALYLLYLPVSLWLRAGRQAAAEVFSRPLQFAFSGEEIQIAQGEESAQLPWENVYKIVSGKRDLFLYTNRIYAYAIPKEQVEEEWRQVLVMAEKHHCRITA